MVRWLEDKGKFQVQLEPLTCILNPKTPSIDSVSVSVVLVMGVLSMFVGHVRIGKVSLCVITLNVVVVTLRL